MAYQFGVADVLSVLGITAADWEIQDYNDNAQKDSAVTRSSIGAHIASSEVQHNDRTDFSISLKAKNPAGSNISFKLGGVGTGGIVLTGFSARQVFNDNGSISIQGHKHNDADGRSHLAVPAEVAVSLSLGFGVQTVYLNGTEIECQGSELSAQMEHVDKYTNEGAFLTGASTGLRVDCSENYVVSGSAPEPSSPWVLDSADTRSVNQDMKACSVRAHRFTIPT